MVRLFNGCMYDVDSQQSNNIAIKQSNHQFFYLFLPIKMCLLLFFKTRGENTKMLLGFQGKGMYIEG